MSALVEVVELVKRFGRYCAVDNVSFSIERGEIFGLLGPNGAGKTTTIRMLTTLMPPTSGMMRIGGIDVRREAGRVRHLLGYVPQSLSADGGLTGYENLLVIAKLLNIPRLERQRRIDEVLALLDLEEAAGRMVRDYSGGMVRRLEVGQAILHRPRLLILDEPTVGLDPTARRSVWEALAGLRRELDVTVLVTSHYMEEIDAACHRVAIMNRGQLSALGTPAELKAATGRPGASLDDVFTAVTGSSLDSGGSYREVRQLRRRAQRLG